MIHLKFYLGCLEWYIAEAQERKDKDIEFFGYVRNLNDQTCSEWGYSLLSELEEIETLYYGVLSVKKDDKFTPKLFKYIK